MRERVSVNDKDFEIYLSKDDIQGSLMEHLYSRLIW